jgi:hypothetical protein
VLSAPLAWRDERLGAMSIVHVCDGAASTGHRLPGGCGGARTRTGRPGLPRTGRGGATGRPARRRPRRPGTGTYGAARVAQAEPAFGHHGPGTHLPIDNLLWLRTVG